MSGQASTAEAPSKASVDVLIPVFNAEATLEAAINSICDQTIDDFRVIIVDDGSTDSSSGLLTELAQRHRRIEVARTTNQGVAAALNHGLSLCRAEFVARFDADDVAYPHRLECQRDYLRAHPECVAVGCDVDHIDADGRDILDHPRPGDPGDADPDWAPAREPYIIHPFLFARTAAIRRVGGYRIMPTSQDSDLYWRLTDLGRLHNMPDRLGKYRIHEHSVSGARIAKGRVMAVSSQLAALSAARRRRGLADLSFPPPETPFALADQGLEPMLDALAPFLEPIERGRFRVAVGAKLLELAGYRAYEPDLDDCRFITGCDLSELTTENRAELRWHKSVTAARLIRRGSFSAAVALAGLSGLPKAMMRLLLKS